MELSEDMEEETGANDAPLQSRKDIDFYPSIVQSLSEEDLKSPAVLKMVISENKKYGQEIKRLKEYENNYYKCDKELAVANEKLKRKTSLEIFTDVSYTIGGIILAFPSFNSQSNSKLQDVIFFLIGLVLILGASISKWGRK